MDELTDKEKLALYETDGINSSYFACQRKMNEMAASINELKVDFTAEDKTFERVLKYMMEVKGISENVLWLEKALKERYPNDKDLKEGQSLNFLEDFTRNAMNKK